MLQSIDPKLNFLEEFAPLFERDMSIKFLDEIKPDALKKKALNMYEQFTSITDLVSQMPKETFETIKNIKTNGIQVNHHYDPILNQSGHYKPEDYDSRYKIFVLLIYLGFSFVGMYYVSTGIIEKLSLNTQLFLALNWGILSIVIVNYLFRKKK